MTETPEHRVAAERGHRWFAATYERRAGRNERTDYAKNIRTRVAGGATGRVLEIGAGTGFNFPYYRDDTEVVATEPDPEMLRRAEPRAREHGIELRAGPAEHLPFPDASFDTVVATGVLCAVDDPVRALSEIRRVLKPGGIIRFCEHVRGDGPRRAMQVTLDPIHYRLFRCHIGRDTLRLMREAGLEVEDLDRLRYADVLGVARNP